MTSINSTGPTTAGNALTTPPSFGPQRMSATVLAATSAGESPSAISVGSTD
jgi:hypothetical protein